jgi:cellulose synthase/poly-beta-1,6-N-acetylglucosamine synthase-like glycosyltransferase
MDWLELVLGGALCLLTVPVGVLLLQVLAALRARKVGDMEPALQPPYLAVLVPAHNEAAVIEETLIGLKAEIRPGDRILVVADNCTDETASIARSQSVEVVERTNLVERGKGFALDFGLRHLQAAPPELLVIVDADCRVAPGALYRLAARALQKCCPVQGLYLMFSPPEANLKLRLAEFAWRVKNQVRPLGWQALGLPCQLMGTGMAFPWALTKKMALANGNIVEDMKLGVEMALQGAAPAFCPDALFTSEFPLTSSAVQSQRKRWEHGHLSMIVSEAPRLFGYALQKRDLRALAMALDLIVPPLALLAALLAGMLMLGLIWKVIGGTVWIAGMAASLCGIFAAAVLLAWWGWGRSVVSFRELMSVPFYVLAKIPLYLGFLTRRQKDWVRTDRK